MSRMRWRGKVPVALRTPTGGLAMVVIIALILLAALAPMLWGRAADHDDIANLLAPSSAAHPLGTDYLGRDILARVLVATRQSLVLAALATLVAATSGISLGALPAVLGRRAGRLVNALIDFSVAFPALLLAIFLDVVLGIGATAVVLAIGLASTPSFARLTETLAASVAGSDYVAAARVVGVRRRRLMWRYILPNVAEPIILNTTLAMGYALLAVSGLSFLGLGVQPPAYDWGRLLNEGLPRIYVTPAAALGPAVAVVIAGLAFNGLGESLASAASARSQATVDRGRRPRRRRRSSAPTTMPETRASSAVLEVEKLSVSFPAGDGARLSPVRGVSFEVGEGEIVGIVGESGSGKSLTALAIAQLVRPPGQIYAARLRFRGKDVADLRSVELRRLLGTSLAMIFQDPVTSLNPALRVGRQLAEVAEVHGGMRRSDAMRTAVERLRRVRIASPDRRAHQYPHELSGGMRQRAMIAMGLMGRPALIIADEPTSALDVTVQRQIVRLLREVSTEYGTAVLFISHDLAVVSELCDRVLVMYAGRIVEELDTEKLTGAAHPYTRALIASVPDMRVDCTQPLATIAGRPPEPKEIPDGCAFAPRCPLASERCIAASPALQRHGTSLVACWHPQTETAAHRILAAS